MGVQGIAETATIAWTELVETKENDKDGMSPQPYCAFGRVVEQCRADATEFCSTLPASEVFATTSLTK